MATIYDHPLYYDILFGWDRSQEAEFYHRVFEQCGIASGARVLEVACGTGQVARRLARLGWAITGLDSIPRMLAFLRDEASAEGLSVEVSHGDMRTFATESAFAAAYNPMSSFRLLESDADAEKHLQQIADALQPGGVYVLDLTLLRTEDESVVTTDESWVMARGDVIVRAENDAVYVSDGGVELVLPWGANGHLRGYTAASFAARVDATPGLQIETWHPESAHDEEGVSLFESVGSLAQPLAGRAMVVLRKPVLGKPVLPKPKEFPADVR